MFFKGYHKGLRPLLDHFQRTSVVDIGWDEAARAASDGLKSAIVAGEITGDLAKWVPGAKSLSCSAFAEAVRRRIKIYD